MYLIHRSSAGRMHREAHKSSKVQFHLNLILTFYAKPEGHLKQAPPWKNIWSGPPLALCTGLLQFHASSRGHLNPGQSAILKLVAEMCTAPRQTYAVPWRIHFVRTASHYGCRGTFARPTTWFFDCQPLLLPMDCGLQCRPFPNESTPRSD
jgi:hypothetical protein